MYEKTMQKINRLTAYLVIAVLMLTTASANLSAQNAETNGADKSIAAADGRNVLEITPRSGSVMKQIIPMPARPVLNVFNSNAAATDIDLLAFDMKGKEIGRETITVRANETLKISLEEIFSKVLLGELSVIELQTSVLSEKADPSIFNAGENSAGAYQLSVGFFSQRQSPWNTYQLGTCPSDTIGSSGCAITAIAMAMTPVVTNLDPGVLNTYLKNNGGYASGCLVRWSNAAGIDGSGGFQYYGSSTVGSAANMKSLIDSGKFSVVKSARFSSHYGTVIGYVNNGTSLSDFYYLDPWDLTAQFRYIGDGFVSSSSAIQIYK